MSSFTPGPWTVSKQGDDFNITYNEHGNWLATVFDDDDPVSGRPEADARLIAAAPDLLEALKSATTSSPDWELITSAIAKAEGRS